LLWGARQASRSLTRVEGAGRDRQRGSDGPDEQKLAEPDDADAEGTLRPQPYIALLRLEDDLAKLAARREVVVGGGDVVELEDVCDGHA
jgi:hypothetical protein